MPPPRTVHIGIFDYDASLRARRLSGRHAEAALAGEFAFPNVLYRWDTGESVYDFTEQFDAEPCVVESDSRRTYPFEDDAALYIADYAGPSQALSPREVLKRQIARADAMGFAAKSAFECEFTILAESAESLRQKHWERPVAWAPDNRCWSADSAGTYAQFVTGLEDVITSLGIPLYGLGTELGPGCIEATLEADTPLKSADDYALFRTFTKSHCRRRGFTASFMAQLGDGFQGLSGHLHLSLADKATGRPLFPDAASSDGMSQTMKHFMAGILTLLPECAALCTHTVNAWRRMVPGNWAPRTPSWDFNNYGVALRVVTATPDTTRIEFRVPAADTNPHLALALALGAGLWGVDNKLELPERATGDVRAFVPNGLRALPRTLLEAAERLEACEPAREIFGAKFIEHFVMTRKHEDAALRPAVSAAERARYLEAI